MSITYINTGTSPNKGDGDSLRSAFIKINQSFSYIDGVLSTSTVDGSNITILDQSIYGTVPNRDIELLPSGTGSVVVPSLTTPSLTISETNTATTAYVGFVYYEQARASNLTPGNYLSTGTFGIPYAVPAPYFVFSATGDNSTINKITAGDFCSGADSKTYPVLARGTGIYQNYIVLDVTEYQLGEEQSNVGTEIHVTRNLNRNFTQFISNTSSGIILDCDNTELQVHGSIIPFEESPDQSLGMPTRRWSDIWLGAGGINIEDEVDKRDIKISANNGNLKLGQTGISVGSLIIHNDYISATTSTRFFVGTDTDILSIDLNGISLTLPGSSIIFSDGTMQTTAYTGGSGSTGDITFSGVKVIGAGTASGDGLGYSTLELVPDANLTSTNQYLIIDPTYGEPGHIHLRAGGPQDSSGADLYLGGELTCVRVSDTSGIVTVRTTNVGDPNITMHWSFQQDGNLYFPGLGNNRIGESEPGLVVSSSDAVVLQSNNSGESKELLFGTNGNLTLPDNGVVSAGGSGGLTLGGNFDVKIIADYTDNNRTWTFNGTDGSITFPDTTVQETAYTGPQTSLVGVIDNNVLVRTSETVITNNLYTNITDFVTDIDPGLGFVINGWSQRNETEIELNLFAPGLGSFYTFLTGLALGRTVVVTYSTVSGNQTFTSTVSQIFSAIAQFDPVTGWQRISGRILGTLPVDQTGIVSVNFLVTTTPQHDWIFGSNGDTIFPFGSDVIFDSSSTSYVYGLSDIEFADGSKPLRRVDTIPASSTSTGTINQVAFTGTDMYVCIAPDYWIKFSGITF